MKKHLLLAQGMQPQNAVLIIDVIVLLSWVPYFRREMLLKAVFSQTLTFQLPSVFMTVCTQDVTAFEDLLFQELKAQI